MEDDLYQIALLIDNLKHDDLKLRLNASNSLVRIAESLGPDRTREELLPFLCEITDDDDEVTTVLAERLGDLCNHVGGAEYIHHLLTPLDLLTSIEESSVRNAVRASS
jgi:serine/threonine-protein phosphatase 2A regulatory subunit A